MRKALFAFAVASSLAVPSRLLDALWTLLASSHHTVPIAKEGCGMDPSGRCVPAPAPRTQLDEGCGMDPDGRCHS
jgi:hypothetical protein